MSSNQWVNYGIAIVVGVVVVVATGGTALAAYGAFLGTASFALTAAYLNGKYATAGLGGSLGKPPSFQAAKRDNGRDAAAESLQINSASESVTIPVPFGRVRVPGNHLRYDLSTFRSTPIIEKVERSKQAVAYDLAMKKYEKNPSSVDHAIDKQASKQQAAQGGGGKGGGGGSSPPPSQTYSNNEKVNAYTQYLLEQDDAGKKKLPKQYDSYVVGHNYYLSWELGFCMGPVDRLHRIISYPGEIPVVIRDDATLAGADTVLTAAGPGQGGAIRFYRGDRDQTRNVADPYAGPANNYRNTCFCVFTNYLMGQSPTPQSYIAEVTRFPVCVDDAGDPVAIPVRGSADSDDPAYEDANPAAILWEVLTNKTWGRGIPAADLDAASFIAAGEFFQSEGLGLSFMLEGQTILSDAVDTITRHCKANLIQVEGVTQLFTELDRSTAYQPMIRLTSDSVQKPECTRPAWPATVNDLRLSFTNRENNYQTELAHAQDMGNLATVGRINSQKLDLPGYSHRTVAERAVKRLLSEMSYPQAILTFAMNRFESRIRPGSFLQFVWSEWSDGPITTYWRVVETTDDPQSEDGIRVICAEDIHATPYVGIPETFTPPAAPWEGTTSNTTADVYAGDDHGADYVAGDMIYGAAELPLILTDGLRLLAIFAERSDGLTQRTVWEWREGGSSDDWAGLGVVEPWATRCTLVGDLPAGRATDRTNSFVLSMSAYRRAAFLEQCADCPTDDDSIDFTLGGETNWLFLGREIFEIAQAEAHADADKVIVTVYARGMHGTDITSHTDGAVGWFVYEFHPAAHTLAYDALPLEGDIDLRITPVSIYGVSGTPGTTSVEITGWALQPFAAAWATASEAALDWTITARPRWHTRGSDTVGDLEEELERLAAETPAGYEWYVLPLDILGDPLEPAPVLIDTADAAFTASDGNDPDTGLVLITYSAPVDTTQIELYQSYNGVLGPATLLTT